MTQQNFMKETNGLTSQISKNEPNRPHFNASTQEPGHHNASALVNAGGKMSNLMSPDERSNRGFQD